MDSDEIVNVVRSLEARLGRTPSVKEIADAAGVSEPTVRNYLQRAVGEGKIIERDSRYMSLTIAAAYDKQKEDKRK